MRSNRDRSMDENNLRWDIPYNRAFFKTSHNSFEKSIKNQLSFGLRGLEYDIHDDRIKEIEDFEVFHLRRSYDVALNLDGNPNDMLFSSWLQIINEWSIEQNSQHAPITLFLELKESLVDLNNKPDEIYGLQKLDEVIINSFSQHKLYSYKDFKKNDYKWPEIKDLVGRVVIVLTNYWGGYWASMEGGYETRLDYLTNSLKNKNGICFVAWTQEDRGSKVSFLKEKVNFWKCSIEYSTKKQNENVNLQRLTRIDFDKIIWGKHIKTYYKKNFKAGFRCNFPSTDYWKSEKYDKCFPWSI